MQSLINSFPFAGTEEHSLIFNMIPMALSNVAFHKNTKSITRYFAEHFPMHLAVHEVSPVTTPPVEYTKPHLHGDSDEINIIISQHDLLYRIQLGDERYTVSNNSCIWIPRGTIHAANVLKGSGHFITIRIS
jgi:mannose-6-phosphate isomerase-like protein (cupin superfamily)